MLKFLNISFIDVLDILLVALLIFEIIRLFRRTSAMGIFVVILLMYVAWIVVRALDMKLLSFLLGQILGVGVVALLIIFQPEIRRFLLDLGSHLTLKSGSSSWLSRLFKHTNDAAAITPKVLDELTAACRKMSETNTGALIVLRHNHMLETYIETGDEIHALINRRLIENIFYKNTPLHDGAMIITKDSIIAARCTLPISDNPNIPPKYGMRHKAALGITEVSDASAIVVSEETGEISFAEAGKMRTMGSITELRLAIENSYKQ